MPAVLYIASLVQEKNIFNVLINKFDSLGKSLPLMKNFDSAIVSCQSIVDMRNVPDNTSDYIFTDPPFAVRSEYHVFGGELPLGVLAESFHGRDDRGDRKPVSAQRPCRISIADDARVL